MARAKMLPACVAGVALLLPAAGLASHRPPRQGRTAATARALLRSPQLWATINVCNPKDQPDWVGIRGSIPGDGAASDRMYMKFTLQDRNRATGVWTNLPGTAAARFVAVGNGRSSREEGESFQLMPIAGKPAFELRGVVEFQWRRGRTVLLSARLPTTSGRRSHAGSDPLGYSAATCQIG